MNLVWSNYFFTFQCFSNDTKFACFFHSFSLFLSCRHLDFFEMVRNEDEKEFAKKFETVREVSILYVSNTVMFYRRIVIRHVD